METARIAKVLRDANKAVLDEKEHLNVKFEITLKPGCAAPDLELIMTGFKQGEFHTDELWIRLKKDYDAWTLLDLYKNQYELIPIYSLNFVSADSEELSKPVKILPEQEEDLCPADPQKNGEEYKF